LAEKRILILTYYWPPSGGGGVQRWMYFAKYLSNLGFKPTVITVDPEKASYPLIDQSQLEMVKNIETIYTSTLEPLKLYSLLKTGKADKAIPYGNLGEKNSGFFGKVMAFIRANFFVPDARKGWVPYATKAASKLLKSNQYEWLITTGPPHSTHLAGLKLAQKFKVKWLADFRDPWTEIYFIQNSGRMRFAQKKDEALENEVLNKADLITTVGPGMADLLRKKLSRPEKLHILYNGYDKEMFENIPLNSIKNELFTISHIGLLGETQRFDSLIDALKNSSLDPKKIRIFLAGTVHETYINRLKQELPNIHFDHKGFVPRQEALSIMKNSELLLLCPPMVGETKLIVSTKTMEYLAASTPVLGIGDTESDAANLVKQQSMSAFFTPENTEGISEYLAKKFNDWQLGISHNNSFNSEPYSRYAVSCQLAEILNSN